MLSSVGETLKVDGKVVYGRGKVKVTMEGLCKGVVGFPFLQWTGGELEGDTSIGGALGGWHVLYMLCLCYSLKYDFLFMAYSNFVKKKFGSYFLG